jgi:DNA-binding Lrp family transcriptional regulator
LGRSEADVIARIGVLLAAGVITRLGVIVRHRALGWTSNAMVVWKMDPARIADAGRALAAHPGVTLCYQRQTVPGVWPFALYSMIHAQSRAEALAVLDSARALPALAGATPRVLFSTRCFKQSGALIAKAA